MKTLLFALLAFIAIPASAQYATTAGSIVNGGDFFTKASSDPYDAVSPDGGVHLLYRQADNGDTVDATTTLPLPGDPVFDQTYQGVRVHIGHLIADASITGPTCDPKSYVSFSDTKVYAPDGTLLGPPASSPDPGTSQNFPGGYVIFNNQVIASNRLSIEVTAIRLVFDDGTSDATFGFAQASVDVCSTPVDLQTFWVD